jgi:hypothetical protein
MENAGGWAVSRITIVTNVTAASTQEWATI